MNFVSTRRFFESLTSGLTLRSRNVSNAKNLVTFIVIARQRTKNVYVAAASVIEFRTAIKIGMMQPVLIAANLMWPTTEVVLLTKMR